MINKVNNKGFTMIELLVVIVLIGIITTIVITSMQANVSEAKNEAEKVFINRINDAIDTYIDLNKKNFILDSSTVQTIKKVISSNGKTEDVNVYQLKLKDDSNIDFSNVINTGFLKKRDFINPKNEFKCDDSVEIDIYRDEDFVYYYSYDLSDSCEIKYNSYPVAQEGDILGDEVFEDEETEEE